MEEIDRLKQEVQAGRLGTEQLLDLVILLQRQLQAAHQRLAAQNQRLAELEQQLDGTTAKVDQPFSLRAEEQRQEVRGKKKRQRQRPGRRGRLRTADKSKLAERTEDVWPEGLDPSQCRLSHVRPVWRLEHGRAVLVAYHIYRGPNNRYGHIPGVLGRSEFGLEIVVEAAYLVYVVGVSFDKVGLLLHFFQSLNLKKAQTDALLKQLARHWEQEFEHLCTLLAHSLVVHTDETRWSLNSVWAFLSEQARVLLFGVRKDAATLQAVLDPATFAGIVFSDDAANYANFTQAQKCWAHLLRKAIKLTLHEPDNTTYRAFTDRLLEIYRQARRVQQDQRFGDAGRARQVAALEDELLDLCAPQWLADGPPPEGAAKDFHLLVNELMRLAVHQQLFTFVTAPPVTQPNGAPKAIDGTNNEAERTLRNAAQARLTGRTSKTLFGARRQTILTSVLESLRLYLPTFTLGSVLAEIGRWTTAGRSCFAALVEKLHFQPAATSVLDQVLPQPSG
jgi:transposase